METYTRLVPARGATREEVERTLRDLGWTAQAVDTGNPRLREVRWTAPGVASTIHWVEDSNFSLNYFTVSGEATAQTIDTLSSHFDFYTPDTLTELADETRDAGQLMEVLKAIAIQSVDQFHPGIFSILRWTLHDPEPVVRRVALLAASLLPWQEVEALLATVLASEPDRQVREEITETLDMVRSRRKR